MKLTQLIPQLEESDSYKVHFSVPPSSDNNPLDYFFRGKFKEWQEGQNRKNFEKDYILSFIKLEKNKWLFVGVYKKLGVKEFENGWYEYETELTNYSKELIGRLVVKYALTSQNVYLHLNKILDKIEPIYILENKLTVKQFNGFENVRISYENLKTIFLQNDKSWQSALSSVKGVYLITDKSNGKLYVGSTYGETAFWNRWSEYIKNGHGGNKTLKTLINTYGIEYAKNFQFSILEIKQSNTSDEEIIKRENHWKEVLLTREFDNYNNN